MVQFGPFRFDPGNGLWRGAIEVPLPPRALGVLTALIAQAGSVVSKQALMDAVWKDAFVTEASLLEAIRVLRDALQDDRSNPVYIQTVHRRGYRFVAEVTTTHALASQGADSATTVRRTTRMAAVPSEWRPLLVAGGAAAVAMIGIAMVFAVFGQRPQPPRPITRFTIALPEDMTLDPLRGSVAVSSDGTRMVYVSLHSCRSRLFLRTVDHEAPQLIDGSLPIRFSLQTVSGSGSSHTAA